MLVQDPCSNAELTYFPASQAALRGAYILDYPFYVLNSTTGIQL